MSETWNKNELPEGHQLIENTKLVAVVEDSWKNAKGEMIPRWDYMSEADDTGASMKISVYSSTDKEALELNKAYDLVVKRNTSKDGSTFYGYGLKGFAPHGEPIVKKEPLSRWNKQQGADKKVEALKAAASVYQGSMADMEESVKIIELATTFHNWLEDKYEAPVKVKEEKGDTKK